MEKKWMRGNGAVTTAQLKIELWIYRCDFLAVSLST